MPTATLPLATLTTFRLGGPATVHTVDDRSELAAVAALAPRWLGRGANLLVADGDCAIPVARLGTDFSGWEILERIAGRARVRAGAGMDLATLVKHCVAAGLAGPEGLAGVPATVGGAVRMNAGTATCWMLDWVDQVEVLLPGEDAPRWISRALLPTSYRQSGLPSGAVVLACDLLLAPGDPAALRSTANRLRAAKAASQPLALPSAGCVFRNPRPDLPAGRLIDQLGLKGTRIGGCAISTVHGNFIVNDHGGTAAQACDLIRLIRARAWSEAGVVLTLEVETWDLPEDLHAHPGRSAA
jgi:UDP-N-acetylmuramate dehydrogenase